MTDIQRLEKLTPPGPQDAPLRCVLDTDTFNEVDDQFALAYAYRSTERLRLEAVYAAPFHNNRSSGPADGMEKSFTEIHRILTLLGRRDTRDFVYRGSTEFLSGADMPCDSPAARDLIRRAREGEGTLYVAAVGAITNVASALLLAPDIAERIVVIWLGGHALYWPTTREFNLMQDLHAARVVLNSGVPLVLLPCENVVSALHTSIPELERHLAGKSAIGDYLTDIVRDYSRGRRVWSKPIWDVAAIAWLVNPDWVPTTLQHSPLLSDDCRWSVDQSRHFIRVASEIRRDAIFEDLFDRLASQ